MRNTIVQAVSTLVIASAAFATAQEAGDWVVITAEAVELQADGTTIETVHRGDWLQVEKKDGKRLRVVWRGRRGWIARSNTVTFEKALDFFEAAVRRDRSSDNFTALGVINLHFGRLEQSIVDLEQAIRIDPKNAAAHFHLGSTLQLSGQHDRAMSQFDESLRLDPENVDALVVRGKLRGKQGDFDGAIADLDAAIAAAPNYAYAYLNRGVARMKQGEIDQALTDFDKAIHLNPQYALAYNNRGTAWRAKGQRDKALADFERAIAIDPNLAIAHMHLGGEREARGDLDGAIESLSESIRLDPKAVRPYNNRATVWEKKGEWEKALADFRKAVQVRPTYPGGHNGVAWVLSVAPVARLRDGKGAVEHATRACELSDCNDPNCLGTLAAAHAECGDFAKAIQWIEKAIDFDPDDDDTVRRKMLTAFERGRPYHVESNN